MKPKKCNPKGVTLKSGCHKVQEYELRLIDKNGDAFDVHHGDTLEEVKGYGCVGDHDGEAVALVIELHTSYHPAHLAPKEPDIYETIETQGDIEALRAGGWVE